MSRGVRPSWPRKSVRAPAFRKVLTVSVGPINIHAPQVEAHRPNRARVGVIAIPLCPGGSRPPAGSSSMNPRRLTPQPLPNNFVHAEWITLHDNSNFRGFVDFLRTELDRVGPAHADLCRDFFSRAVALEL